jgi:hypothetical protein
MSTRLWMYCIGIGLVIILAAATPSLTNNSNYQAKVSNYPRGLTISAPFSQSGKATVVANSHSVVSQSFSTNGSSVQVQPVSQANMQGGGGQSSNSQAPGQSVSQAVNPPPATTPPITTPVTNQPVQPVCNSSVNEPISATSICKVCPESPSVLLECGGCHYGNIEMMCAYRD